MKKIFVKKLLVVFADCWKQNYNILKVLLLEVMQMFKKNNFYIFLMVHFHSMKNYSNLTFLLNFACRRKLNLSQFLFFSFWPSLSGIMKKIPRWAEHWPSRIVGTVFNNFSLEIRMANQADHIWKQNSTL